MEILLVTSYYRNWDKPRPDGPFGSYADVTFPTLHMVALMNTECDRYRNELVKLTVGFSVSLKHGLTPLHVATHYNNDKVATFLLENNADPNAMAKVSLSSFDSLKEILFLLLNSPP